MSNCRSCNADIVWGNTPSGKKIPLDVERLPFGNIQLHDDESATFVKPSMTPMWRSHFVTCTSSEAHRRKHPPVPIAKGQTQKQVRTDRERVMYEAAMRETRIC